MDGAYNRIGMKEVIKNEELCQASVCPVVTPAAAKRSCLGGAMLSRTWSFNSIRRVSMDARQPFLERKVYANNRSLVFGLASRIKLEQKELDMDRSRLPMTIPPSASVSGRENT